MLIRAACGYKIWTAEAGPQSCTHRRKFSTSWKCRPSRSRKKQPLCAYTGKPIKRLPCLQGVDQPCRLRMHARAAQHLALQVPSGTPPLRMPSKAHMSASHACILGHIWQQVMAAGATPRRARGACRPLNMALKRLLGGAWRSVDTVVMNRAPPTFRVTCSEARAATCGWATAAPQSRHAVGLAQACAHLPHHWMWSDTSMQGTSSLTPSDIER